MSHLEQGKFSSPLTQKTWRKIGERVGDADRPPLAAEEENIIFQRTYKETTGCKSSKTHGHGYLAKYPTRSELLTERLDEQARVAAAAEQRNNDLQEELQKMKERLAKEVAEREREKEESRRQMNEKLESTRNEIAEQLKKELFSMIAQQKETTPQQTTTGTVNTNNISETLTEQATTGTMTTNDVAATPTEHNGNHSTEHIEEQVPKSNLESVLTTQKESGVATRSNRNSNLPRNLFPVNKSSGAASFVTGHQLQNVVRTRSHKRK